MEIKIIGTVMLLLSSFSSAECMNYEEPLKHALKSELIDKYKRELQKSVIHVLVTEWNQRNFATNLKQTLEMNMDELKKVGVRASLLITCDGVQEDYDECLEVFKDFSFDYSIDFQENNLGCSKTRWNQLQETHRIMAKEKKNGELPYFFIFDGDDIIHKDLLLLELLTQLETNVMAVNVGDKLNCRENDSENIFKEIANSSIESFSFSDIERIESEESRIIPFEDWAFSLFSFEVSEWLQNNVKEFNPLNDLVTLDPLRGAIEKKYAYIFIHKDTSINWYGCNDIIPLFFDEKDGNYKCRLSLFYYMQHGASLERSPLVSACQRFKYLIEVLKEKSEDSDFIAKLLIDASEHLFFFGKPEVADDFKVNEKQNKSVTKDFLLQHWQNMHNLAIKLQELKSIEGSVYSGTKNDLLSEWLRSGKCKLLLEQYQLKPLSKDFMEDFYKPVFDIIFLKSE